MSMPAVICVTFKFNKRTDFNCTPTGKLIYLILCDKPSCRARENVVHIHFQKLEQQQ